MHEQFFELADPDIARAVFGHRDEFLRLVEQTLMVDLHARGQRVTLRGDELDVTVAVQVLDQLRELAENNIDLSVQDVTRIIELERSGDGTRQRDILSDIVLIGARGKAIAPKTPNQQRYVEEIRRNDIVFGIGPAGTGKTYLAMAHGVAALLNGDVKRIVLTRPAVEAGEKLGFLPGDLMEKVSPYLRPLYDALYDMVELERAKELIERNVVEVVPLAFMRGRTLNDSFVILDEAQNASREQMKMFLTRLGYGSKTVITGDTSQVDLGPKVHSGLAHAVRLLEGVEGIAVSRLTIVDVVRHPLVRRIIMAYERDEALSAQEWE